MCYTHVHVFPFTLGVLGLMHVHVCMHAFWVLVYCNFGDLTHLIIVLSVSQYVDPVRYGDVGSRQAPKEKKVGFVNYMYMQFCFGCMHFVKHSVRS